MSKLVTYFSDEKRIHVESDFTGDGVKLMVQSHYGEDELVGTFREINRKLTLVLEKDQKVLDIKVATDPRYEDVTSLTVSRADNEIPF